MGNPDFLPPTESVNLEVSTQKIAQVITQAPLTRVPNLVMITPPHFSPQMGEYANPNYSIPFLSFPSLPFPFFLAHVYSLNAWTDFDA